MTGPTISPTPQYDAKTMASLIARRIVAEKRYSDLLRALGMDPTETHEDALAVYEALMSL